MATVVNEVTDPLVGAVATYGQSNATTGPTRVAADADLGVCVEVTKTGVGANAFGVSVHPNGGAGGAVSSANAIAVLQGDLVFLQADVKIPTMPAGGCYPFLSPIFWNGAAYVATQNADRRYWSPGTIAAQGNVFRLMGVVTIPAGVTHMSPGVGIYQGGSAGNLSLRATRFMCVKNPDRVPQFGSGTITLTDGTGLGDFLFGYSEYHTPTDDLIAAHVEAGANCIRLGISPYTGGMQPVEGGPIHLGYYARFVDRCMDAGLRPIFLVGGKCPRWMVDPATTDNQFASKILPPHSSKLDAYAKICEAVAARWPDAAAMEVWNEPNLASYFWQNLAGTDLVDPTAYTNLVKAIYPRVKTVAPNMKVLAGSTAHIATSAASYQAAGTFISNMYAAGLVGYYDGLSIHPYFAGNQDGATCSDLTTYQYSLGYEEHIHLSRLWQMLVGVNPNAVSTWCTEGGCGLADESKRAKGERLYLGIARARPDVKCWIKHHLTDPVDDAFCAIDSSTFRRKQTFDALRNEAGHNGRVRRTRIPRRLGKVAF